MVKNEIMSGRLFQLVLQIILSILGCKWILKKYLVENDNDLEWIRKRYRVHNDSENAYDESVCCSVLLLL